MKYWAFALTALVALPVNAYVQNWNHDSDPLDALRRLESRANTCPSDNPTSCSAVDSQLPGNFCCGKDTTCISIDQSTSAICCPNGQNCDNIGTINCDVSLQDASKNKGPIFTTNLNQKLPTCGDKCCPFGYTCGQANGNNVCVLDKSKSGPASTTQVTSTTSATITSTSTSTPTTLASGIDSKDPPPTKEASNFPTGVFFAGFFPGLVVGVLITLAWVVLTKRNNKPADSRGLNMSGTNGERPFISAPLKDARHSNERSDFLGRTRSRARSMFSTHRRSRTMDSTDMWGVPKMPTPPVANNVPVNYINDMQDVPVTPHRRVARYHSDENIRLSHGPSIYGAGALEKELDLSPISSQAEAEVSDFTRPETIRIYSPEILQSRVPNESTPAVPMVPQASIPPLRGMNTRRVSPPYGGISANNAAVKGVHPAHLRKDSGTAMGITIGSPFQTPEKKPTIVNNATPSMYATYHDATTVGSPTDDNTNNHVQLQTLTPARYNPHPYPIDSQPTHQAATLATKNLTSAQLSLPSQQKPQKPTIPPRPIRPETRDFDFDEGLDDTPHRHPQQQSQQERAVNPNATFESLLTAENAKFKKDKHATNATTFTTMLRNVGFPDPGNQIGGTGGVPAVPKLNVGGAGAGGKKGGKGGKGMI